MEAYEDIKLIACDMDGTLLDEHSQVPLETFDLVRALDGAGIRFVAASGRRYDTLRAFFEPVADRMDFVASNGAQVFVRGKLVDREVFSHAALRRLYALVNEFDNLHMVVYDRTNSYLLDDPACFDAEFDKDLPNPVVLRDLPSPDTSIVKVSISCDSAQMDMAYILSRELEADFVFAPSRQREPNFKSRMRTGIHALPTQHTITCRHSVGLAGERGIQDLGVAQARRLACAAMHTQIMVDLHAHQAYATKRFVHTAKRAQRAAPHAARPEQLRNHNRRQREDPRKRAEQHGLIHGAYGIHQFEHGHAAYCGKSKHRRRDPDLRLARNRALAHRNAQLAAKPINELTQQVHRTRPAAKSTPANYAVNRQNRKRPGKAGKSNAFRRNCHLNRSEWIKQIESKQMR